MERPPEWRTYLITYRTYGSYLPGHPEGSIDRRHNAPGAPYLAPNQGRLRQAERLLRNPPYNLTKERRMTVLQAIMRICRQRRWELFACHVRSNHVHAVTYADDTPEKVMNAFKAYSSRALNEARFDAEHPKRWARHGSTRYLWKEEHIQAAVDYVVDGQGEPMALFVGDGRPVITR